MPSPIASIGWEVLDRIRVGDVFAISPHGIGIAVGFLAGSYVFLHEARRRGVSEEHGSTLVLRALVGTIIGARLFYVLGHWGEPGLETFADVLAVWRGGISLIGGIFGAIIVAYPAVRRFHIGFLRVMDPAVIGIALGIVIGRIGDLIIGDHLGKPTSWALAFVYRGGELSGYSCVEGLCRTTLQAGQKIQEITEGGAVLATARGEELARGLGVHQTALYDFFSTMALVVLLLWLNRGTHRTGVLTLTFGVWYGSVRIITDFLRVDKQIFGLTGSQWASILVVVLCVGTALWWAIRPDRRVPSPEGDEELEAGAEPPPSEPEPGPSPASDPAEPATPPG
jgi:phosphatidylglycerol:prolipoprotein diacylglycerol transferase